MVYYVKYGTSDKVFEARDLILISAGFDEAEGSRLR